MNLQDQIRIRDRIAQLRSDVEDIKKDLSDLRQSIEALSEKVSRGTVRGRPRKQVNG